MCPSVSLPTLPYISTLQRVIQFTKHFGEINKLLSRDERNYCMRARLFIEYPASRDYFANNNIVSPAGRNVAVHGSALILRDSGIEGIPRKKRKGNSVSREKRFPWEIESMMRVYIYIRAFVRG